MPQNVEMTYSPRHGGVITVDGRAMYIRTGSTAPTRLPDEVERLIDECATDYYQAAVRRLAVHSNLLARAVAHARADVWETLRSLYPELDQEPPGGAP